MPCLFIPAYLLDHLARHREQTLAVCGRRTREIDAALRERRTALARPAPHGEAAWAVHTADNTATLPGRLVRSAGQDPVGDAAVDEAATGISQSLALLTDLGRTSYDDAGATVLATVHYERDYDNAFWDGRQLVFGDGDGRVFARFTGPVDVAAHELFHAVTQHTADLVYTGQSGALNESVSDCFGSCVKQRHLGQRADEADWLIGEGIFLPGVHGRALRSMSAPGTAYDDPAIGQDPQVATMANYVETSEDNGGVHINSGIPNKAFQLAATAIGGLSWEGAGMIWYAALTSGLPADCDFASFARACVAVAGGHADAVREAWREVGVLDGGGAGGPGGGRGAAPAPSGTLTVRRSGGFGGIVREASLDLDSEDPRAARARALLGHTDPAHVAAGTPAPDRFVYEFRWAAGTLRVHEPALTPELGQVARLVLDGD